MGKKGFLWLEAMIYGSFLYLDLQGGALPEQAGRVSSLLKYAGVCLCFFYLCRTYLRDYGASGAGIRWWRYQNENKWLTAGLFGTICADFFLLFTEKWFAGVSCFIVVQLFYRIWLKMPIKARKTGERNLFLQVSEWIFHGLLWSVGASVLLLSLLAALGVSVDALLSITAIYFMLLLQNTIEGIRSGRRSFAVGMCLFLLCDLQVGIYNAAVYLPQMEGTLILSLLEQVASVGMWACYLPAKVLIALSGEKRS